MDFAFSSKRFNMRFYRLSDYRAWRAAHEAAGPKQNEFDGEKKQAKELTLQEFRKFLARDKGHRRDKVIYHFAVFEKKTGRLMGYVMLALILRFNVQSARISYVLFNNYWKHGFGREIVEAALQFSFRKLKLHRIEAEIQPGNRASLGLVKALGFQPEGVRRGAVYFDHAWHDHLVYALLAEDRGVKNTRPVILR